MVAGHLEHRLTRWNAILAFAYLILQFFSEA